MLAAHSWAAPANASTGIVTSTKAIKAHFACMTVSLEADVSVMDRLPVKVAPENSLPIACVAVLADDNVVITKSYPRAPILSCVLVSKSPAS